MRWLDTECKDFPPITDSVLQETALQAAPPDFDKSCRKEGRWITAQIPTTDDTEIELRIGASGLWRI